MPAVPRCVVVEGRYGHVSFVLDPAPLQLHVLDVAPPWPAKLLDQVERVLRHGRGPARRSSSSPDVVELRRPAARTEPAEHYLLPCRGGGMDVAGPPSTTSTRSRRARDWTLLGCARSRPIHDCFYGDARHRQVDICPRSWPAGSRSPRARSC